MKMKFQNNVKIIREKAKLKAISVADACGLSKGTMSKIEHGERRMYPEELIAIAHELKCHPYELIPEGMRPKNLKMINSHHVPIEGVGALISMIETYYPKLDPAQQRAAKGAIIALLNGNNSEKNAEMAA